MVERMAVTPPGPEQDGPRSPGRPDPPPGKASDPNPTSEPPGDSEPLDLQEGLRRCFSEYDMFQKLVGMFFEEVDPLVARMQTALQAGEDSELARAAHRLKGTVAYLGARPATAAAGRVEAIGMSGCLESAAHALHQLDQEIQRLKPALQSHLEQPAGHKYQG